MTARLKSVAMAAVLWLAVATASFAATLHLTYPTERADGSALPLAEITACYVVDVTGGGADLPVCTLTPPATTCSVPNSSLLVERKFQAYCEAGVEGARSSVVTVLLSPAKAPGLSISLRVGAQ